MAAYLVTARLSTCTLAWSVVPVRVRIGGRGTKLYQANSSTYAIRLISWAAKCHQAA